MQIQATLFQRIAALLLVLVFSLLAWAQEATPSPTAAATPTVEATAVAGPALEKPYLQADLNLLVGNVQRPNGMVYFEGDLFTVCNGDWTVYKIDAETGETITFVFGVRNGNNLIAEATASGFDLWIPDPDNSALWKVDEQRSAPVSISSQLAGPWGIVRLDASRFLLTDARANTILEISEQGERQIAQSGLRAPTGIARQGNRVYFANGGSARRGIEYFDIEGDGQYSEVKPLVSGLQNTTNILLGSDGYLYFAYALGTRGVVGRIEPSQCVETACSHEDVQIVVFSDTPAPLAIALAEDMRLFLHSRFRPEIYWTQLPT